MHWQIFRANFGCIRKTVNYKMRDIMLRQFYSSFLFIVLLFLIGCVNKSSTTAQNSPNSKQNPQNNTVEFHLIGDQ